MTNVEENKDDSIWKDRIERAWKYICRTIDQRQRRDAVWVCNWIDWLNLFSLADLFWTIWVNEFNRINIYVVHVWSPNHWLTTANRHFTPIVPMRNCLVRNWSVQHPFYLKSIHYQICLLMCHCKEIFSYKINMESFECIILVLSCSVIQWRIYRI